MSISYSTTTRNNDLDEFRTPRALVEAAVKLLHRQFDTHETFFALEPGANTGVWGSVLRENFPHVFLVGVEQMIMPREYKTPYDMYVDGVDFLSWEIPFTFDLVIGNPPYSIRTNGKKEVVAEKFVRKGLSLLCPTGHLYFLLRSGFRHSRERYWQDRRHRTTPGIHQTHHYKECWACTPRPSFYLEDDRTEQFGTVKTNAHDYDLMVWEAQWRYPYGFARELDWDYEHNIT